MRCLGQAALCVASTIATVLFVAEVDHRGPANRLALLAPPVVIALAPNRSGDRRAVMAMPLLVAHVICFAATRAPLIGY